MSEIVQPIKAKLSQWEALTLESLKKLGWSNERILHDVENGELPADESKFKFDYSVLTQLLHDDKETLTNAIKYGYAIKYNTIRGIHSFILIVFNIEALLILEPNEEAVIAKLMTEQAQYLQTVLSYGWKINVVESPPEQYSQEQKEVENYKNYDIYEVKLVQENEFSNELISNIGV